MAIGVARNKDGRLEVFARGTDNSVWHDWQTTAGASWGGFVGWARLEGGTHNDVCVGVNYDGRLEYFVVNDPGNCWHAWQTTPGGQWSAPDNMGGHDTDGGLTGTPTVISNTDGRLEIFVRSNNGSTWHNWQTPGGAWAGWAQLEGGTHHDVGVGINKDGRLEYFIINDPGNCWHAWQTTPGGQWSTAQDLGGHDIGGGLIGTPAVMSNQDGRLEIFIRSNNGSSWHNWQTPSGAWAGWAQLEGGTHHDVGVGINKDGRLEYFIVNDPGNCWHSWQTTPGGPYAPAQNLGGHDIGGGLTGSLASIANDDGRLEVFSRANDGAIWHNWQANPGGAWTNWESLGVVAPPTSPKFIGLTIPYQAETFWCWVAVGSGIASFYDGVVYQQCYVVTLVFSMLDPTGFDGTDCCSPTVDPSQPPCNGESGVDQALDHPQHHFAGNVGRPLDWTEITGQIDQGRPFAAEIGWQGGGNHFVAITGYTYSAGTPSVPLLYVQDPAYGPSWYPLSVFQSSYEGTGNWQYTTLSQP